MCICLCVYTYINVRTHVHTKHICCVIHFAWCIHTYTRMDISFTCSLSALYGDIHILHDIHIYVHMCIKLLHDIYIYVCVCIYICICVTWCIHTCIRMQHIRSLHVLVICSVLDIHLSHNTHTHTHTYMLRDLHTPA